MTKAESFVKHCPHCKASQMVKRPVAQKFRSVFVKFIEKVEACSLCSGRGFLDPHAAELVAKWQPESIG